jgi:hypothetical protein
VEIIERQDLDRVNQTRTRTLFGYRSTGRQGESRNKHAKKAGKARNEAAHSETRKG